MINFGCKYYQILLLIYTLVTNYKEACSRDKISSCNRNFLPIMSCIVQRIGRENTVIKKRGIAIKKMGYDYQKGEYA